MDICGALQSSTLHGLVPKAFIYCLRRRTLHGYFGALQSSTLHGLVPEAATVLMRPTTVRWDLTKQQADLTKQNTPC